MNVIDLKVTIQHFAEVVAAEVLKLQSPVKDEISMRQAKKEFTTAWINYHDIRGNIKWTRRGPHDNSARMTSRSELLALRMAEKEGAKIAIREIEQKQDYLIE